MKITPITPAQWNSIGKVVLFIAGSIVIAVAIAYVSNDPALIALMPVINILAVTLEKFLTKGEVQAVSQLPTDLQLPAQQAIDKITTTATTAVVEAVTPKQ